MISKWDSMIYQRMKGRKWSMKLKRISFNYSELDIHGNNND